MKFLIVVGFLMIGMMQVTANAQSEVVQSTSDLVYPYGNQGQSGTRVYQAISEMVNQGSPLKESISKIIDQAIENEETTVLSLAALTSVRKNKATTLAFMDNMMAYNDLFAATKSSIESQPEDASNIINVSIVLYPDFAQVVINAAVMTGEMDSNEALLAAISAGADPTSVSEATAAGGPVENAGLPIDGLGGGGNGNEDPSASTN